MSKSPNEAAQSLADMGLKPTIERSETERYTAEEAKMMLRAVLQDVLSKYDEGITYTYAAGYKGVKKKQASLWFLTAGDLLSYLDGWEPITEENHKQVADELARAASRQADDSQEAGDWWTRRAVNVNTRFAQDD